MAENTGPMQGSGDITPRPDPTAMTSQALVREISALRQTLEAVIDGKVEVITTRLGGMDEAIRLVRDGADRLPTQMDTKVAQLRALHDERFNGVQLQFHERDTRVKDAAEASDAALKAALAAAKEQAGDQVKSLKESIDKSEAATTKQIDTQGTSINTATAGLDRQIGDLKERLTRIEAGVLGRTAAVVDQRASAGEIRGYVATAVGLVLVVLAILGYFATH